MLRTRENRWTIELPTHGRSWASLSPAVLPIGGAGHTEHPRDSPRTLTLCSGLGLRTAHWGMLGYVVIRTAGKMVEDPCERWQTPPIDHEEKGMKTNSFERNHLWKRNLGYLDCTRIFWEEFSHLCTQRSLKSHPTSLITTWAGVRLQCCSQDVGSA